MPTARIHSVKTISSHESYHGWPTLARLADGTLMAVTSAGRERHVCPFGQVHLIRSGDNGASWSEPQIVINSPLDDRDAGLIQTGRGTLLLNWFTSLAWKWYLEKAESEGAEALQKLGHGFVARCQKIRALLSPEVIQRELGAFTSRSEDGGKTWSAPVNCGVSSPHGPVELQDGRILYVGKLGAEKVPGKHGSPFRSEMGARISADDGKSWLDGGLIPARPGDDVANYHEPHAVETTDGRIVVHIRNHNEQDHYQILQSESTDGGQSFSVPHNTGLDGYPAHLLRLRDGRLLSTFGYRKVPRGNHASISENGGRSWSEPMVLDEHPQPRDIGYPSSVEMADGSLMSLWYERLPDTTNAVLRLAHWSLA